MVDDLRDLKLHELWLDVNQSQSRSCVRNSSARCLKEWQLTKMVEAVCPIIHVRHDNLVVVCRTVWDQSWLQNSFTKRVHHNIVVYLTKPYRISQSLSIYLSRISFVKHVFRSWQSSSPGDEASWSWSRWDLRKGHSMASTVIVSEFSASIVQGELNVAKILYHFGFTVSQTTVTKLLWSMMSLLVLTSFFRILSRFDDEVHIFVFSYDALFSLQKMTLSWRKRVFVSDDVCG